MTSNKSWFHHFKSKTNCTARNRITSQPQRRQRLEQWAQLVKLLEIERCILVDSCLWETITLFTHSRHWQTLCDNSLMKKNIISQHNNVWPQATCLSLEKTEKYGWEILAHPQCSPDLAPSDCNYSGILQDHVRGWHYKKK
jgi:hypothetical protein